jgi:uncharacterized protein
MLRTNRASSFYPDYIVDSVLQITPEKLKSLGVTHIAFDVDDTLVPRGQDTLSPEYLAHLQKLEEEGIQILIGSNTQRDITNVISQLKGQIVRPTTLRFKPQKAYYKSVVSAAKTTTHHVAMAGDRILNDIIGANRAGLITILVLPFARKPGRLHKLYLKRAKRKTT